MGDSPTGHRPDPRLEMVRFTADTKKADLVRRRETAQIQIGLLFNGPPDKVELPFV
jgi:hypothetical protein